MADHLVSQESRTYYSFASRASPYICHCYIAKSQRIGSGQTQQVSVFAWNVWNVTSSTASQRWHPVTPQKFAGEMSSSNVFICRACSAPVRKPKDRRNLVSVWSLLNWSSFLYASEAACEMSLSENIAITTVDALWLASLPLKTTWGTNELLYTYWQCVKIRRCQCAVDRDFDIR